MKMKFNKKAAASFAKEVQYMAHAMFVAIEGLSTWKGTSAGLAVGFLVWFALQVFAFILSSLSSDDDDGQESG